MTEKITIKGDGISVDLLLWRTYGVRGRALIEQTYDINPGLAALGPIIPHNVTVTLPDRPDDAMSSKVPVVSLFGQV